MSSCFPHHQVFTVQIFHAHHQHSKPSHITTIFFLSAVPATSLHITTGRGPFTGFLAAHEGSAPPFMADVARLYASKLKDALVSAARYAFYQNPFNLCIYLFGFLLFMKCRVSFKSNCNGLSFSSIFLFSVVGSLGKARTKMLIHPRWSQKLKLQLHYHIGNLIPFLFWTKYHWQWNWRQ